MTHFIHDPRAGGAGGHGPRPDGGAGAGKRDGEIRGRPGRRAGLHRHRGVGPRHPGLQHHHHQPGRPLRAGPALPAPGAGGARAPAGLRATCWCPPTAGSTRRPRSGSGSSRSPPSWGPGCAWPCATWRSGGPATSWGRPSTGTSRRWDSIFTASSWRRPCENCEGEPAAERVDPVISADVEALLPESFVPEVNQRLALYKRLAEIERPEESRGRARRAGGSVRPAAPAGRGPAWT